MSPKNLALPKEQREQMNTDFDALLAEMEAKGELLGGEGLADPASSRLYRWKSGKAVATDGPYAESKEQFAGFFMIDVATRERAEELAARFSGPGETIELRPAMWPGGDEG
ncbi:YciI family protein [Arthrobacter sp. SA17]